MRDGDTARNCSTSMDGGTAGPAVPGEMAVPQGTAVFRWSLVPQDRKDCSNSRSLINYSTFRLAARSWLIVLLHASTTQQPAHTVTHTATPSLFSLYVHIIHIHTETYTYTHTHMHTTHTHTYAAHTRTCTHTHTNTYTQRRILTHIHTCTPHITHTYAAHTRTRTHTQTHIHIA